MSEYTYKDIIIDPNDPRVVIGKEYYWGESPRKTIDRANNKGGALPLFSIDRDEEHTFPFYFCQGSLEGGSHFLIRKKGPSYIERYCKWLADNGIKTGDEVLVTRKAANNEDGWDHSWAKEMDAAVGKVLKIEAIGKDSVFLSYDDGEWWEYPYFVLEKVEQKYVPFDLSNEEDRATLRGAWLKLKEHSNEVMVKAIYPFFNKVSIDNEEVSPDFLLENYEFLDGTPCGQEVKE